MVSPQPFSSNFPLNQLQPSGLLCHQPLPYQQNLHLIPSAWDHFLQLDSPTHRYCDFIEGLIVCCLSVGTKEHDELRDSHATVMRCSLDVTVSPTPSIQILNSEHQLEWTIHRDSDESNPNEASSSNDRRVPSQSSLLHPDFAISKSRRVSDTSDSSGGTGLASKLVKLAYPYTSRLLVVGEVTSESTCQVDLGYKWNAYARSGVPMYVILDRGTKNQSKRIIFGSLSHFSGAEKSTSADHLTPPASRPRRGPPPPAYYRKVYHSHDIVDCLYYSSLQMTAAQLLDLRTMRTLATKLRHEQRNERWKAEEAERKAEEAGREREEAERKAEEAGREREEAERKAEEAERKAEEAERKAEEAERKAEEAERKAEEAERKAEEAERKAEEAERKREEAERKRKERDERRKREQVEERLRRIESDREEEKRRQRKAPDEKSRKARAVGEGSSRNVERKDKKAPAGEKASSVKEQSSSSSSPKTNWPLHKKSRKK